MLFSLSANLAHFLRSFTHFYAGPVRLPSILRTPRSPFAYVLIRRPAQFKIDIVELSVQWTEDEHKIRLGKGWKLIKSQYKGGGGKHGIEPVKFPVDYARAQNEAGQSKSTGKQAKKRDMRSGMGGREGREEESKGNRTSSLPINRCEDPQSLLRQLHSEGHAGSAEIGVGQTNGKKDHGLDGSGIEIPGITSAQSHKGKKKLIQEMYVKVYGG